MDWLDELILTLGGYFDKDRAMECVRRIHDNDRYFDFARMNLTASVVCELMKEAGLAEIEMLPIKANGRTKSGDWTIPRAWDAHDAKLTIVSPALDERDAELCEYNKVPCSLALYSAPLPEGGVTARVVDVDAYPDPYELDLNGAILLTGRWYSELIGLATEKGAIGIIGDHFPAFEGVRDDPASDMADHSRWEVISYEPMNDCGLFGFSLSPRAGGKLRALLREHGTVTLHATVDTKIYDGVVHTVSGLLPGSDPVGEEAVFTAHLYEPGANDNASGCGALIELAAAVNRMISDKKIPRPKRGLRFIMSLECAGQYAYIDAHGDRAPKMVGAMNLDMIGSSAEDRAPLSLRHSPASNASCLDLFLPEVARRYECLHQINLNATERGFYIDNTEYADPMIGVPTVNMIMHPAKSYHSSMDDMRMVDADVLARNATIAGAVMLFAADAGQPFEIISELTECAPAEIYSVNNDATAYIKVLRENQIARSFRRLFGESAPARGDKTLPAFQPACGEMAGAVPKRKVAGTLTLSGVKNAAGFGPRYNYTWNCPLFWTDGARTLGEIAALSAAELGLPDPDAFLSELARYYAMLYENGYITFSDSDA